MFASSEHFVRYIDALRYTFSSARFIPQFEMKTATKTTASKASPVIEAASTPNAPREAGTRFQELLANELKRRKSLRPSYSLRAFARDLKISPSFLSDLLTNKRFLSPQKAIALASALRLSDEERNEWVFRSQMQRAKTDGSTDISLDDPLNHRNHLPSRLIGEAPLSVDKFETLSSWYALAILELSNLAKRPRSHAEIAERLGITLDETTEACERLIRLGLAEKDAASGELKKKEKVLAVPATPGSQAIRNFHRQMIHHASESIDQIAVEHRDISGSTVSFDRTQIDEIRKEITRFRKTILKLCTQKSNSNANDVYQLNVQFFPLTKPLSPSVSSSTQTKSNKHNKRKHP